ncbi:putative beta-glucosidase G [Lasiodiplodia hormozganensis]|uniref:Probable beta-glucosidase G n=1 Tax=Lasiodiplodia hormozganensis TaxID=869390 RepID=A0AA39Y074_9PEZI|nr:putative beta-glucosidase G [Lasiodiplodia hormozganensis]
MKYTVKGTQEEGVQACAKHFIGNEQETQRSNVIYPDGTEVAAISSNIDDRTLHELYLPPFADAVKAGVATVMCGYNRLNQTYTCQNSKLLNGILKEELGFLGYVVSDFYATHDGVPAIEAGLDMNMPGPWDSMTAAMTYLGGNNASLWGQNLTTSVGNGSLSEERLDDMIRRIMTPYFHLGQNEGFPSVDPSGYFITAVTAGYIQTSRGAPPARDVRGDHAKLIRRIGAEATVLLKNVNSTLPLKTPLSIGVFGNDAGLPADGMYVLGDDPPYPGVPRSGYEMGTLSVGGGSGSGRSTYVVSPLNALMARAKNFGGRVQYILDNALIAKGDFSTLYPTPEVCLVFLKTWCGEGTDRASFENDWNSTLVVERVASHCPNTVVVTHSAGVNTMPWAENENVTAILAAHYPGQESGNSIVDVLFGDINPSGRLPYTIPRREADYALPITNMTGDQSRNASAWQSDFTEGLYIDYRHFDAMNITPLYDFGYGLSYTTFEIVGTPSADLLQKELPPFPPSSQVEPGGIPGSGMKCSKSRLSSVTQDQSPAQLLCSST